MTPNMPNSVAVTSTAKDSTWSVLAGVRFLLAAVVVCEHIREACKPSLIGQIGRFNAFSAVMCFFVLSGFSIAASINKTPNGFYLRRFWRIYPVYITAIFLCCTLWAANGSRIIHTGLGVEREWHPIQMIEYCFMGQSFIVGQKAGMAQGWSLSIECFFYALAPFFMRMPRLAIISLCAVSALCFLHHGDLPIHFMIQGAGAACVLVFWLGGMAYYRWQGRAMSVILLVVGIILLTFYNERPAPGESVTPAFPLFALTCIALFGASHVRLSETVKSRLEWLGDLSYPLYLIHPIIVLAVCRWFGGNAVVAVTLAGIVSIVVLYGVDYPARAFAKKRIFRFANNSSATLTHGRISSHDDIVRVESLPPSS